MRLVVAALLASLLGGCVSSYPEASAGFRAAFESGDFAAAAELAEERAEDLADPSALVWLLEAGAARRAEGRAEAAALAFERAEALLAELDRRPEVSLSGESLSAFSNPLALDYRGRNAERILAATALALTHLEAGSVERARVALNRALFRIEDARRIAARRAEIAREEGEAASGGDPSFRQRLASPELAEAARAATDGFGVLPARAASANPAAAWLHGLFLLHTAEDGSDLERARKSLQLVAGTVPGVAGVASDLALAESGRGRPDPGPGRTLVYVLHENGVAPRRGQETATLPLLLLEQDTPMVAIALPTLRPAPAAGESLDLSWGDGRRAATERLASVDAMMLAEFREEWPSAVTRALASATVKALVGHAANRAARESARRNSDNTGAQLLYLATLVTTNLYAGVAQADTRGWTSLPKEYLGQRLEAPRGARISLGGACLGSPAAIDLPQAKAVLVTVRTLGPGVPPVIRTAILQP